MKVTHLILNQNIQKASKCLILKILTIKINDSEKYSWKKNKK